MTTLLRNLVALVFVAGTLALIYEVIEVGLANGAAQQEVRR